MRRPTWMLLKITTHLSIVWLPLKLPFSTSQVVVNFFFFKIISDKINSSVNEPFK